MVGYKERHHVVPRCEGGGNDAGNIVELTGREHWLAHKLLIFLYPENWKLVLGAVFMAKKAANGRAFEWLRHRRSLAVGLQRRGTKASIETRAKQSIAQRGRKHTPEAKAKCAAAKIGNKYGLGVVKTTETRAKLSRAFTGRPLTTECKAKISASRMGMKPSQETRIKLSIAHTGLKRTAGSIEKTASAHRGKKRQPFSLEWREKLSAAGRRNKNGLGKKHSPEHRAKISSGVLAAFAKRDADRLGLMLGRELP